MSTKIYYGFKTTLTLLEILDRVRDFRKTVWEPHAQEMLEKFLQRDKTEGYRLWCELRREVQKTNVRDSLVDTDFQIVLFPIPKKSGGFLGMIFTENIRWYEAWLAHDHIQEYGYWDNSDEPKGVTRSAWEKRRKLWDSVLGETNVPAKEGFTIDVHGSGPWPK